MRIDGATIQTAAAIAWGIGIALAFLGHTVPTAGLWGTIYWTGLGWTMLLAVALIVGLGMVKLVGDAISPEWVDRWWDRSRYVGVSDRRPRRAVR